MLEAVTHGPRFTISLKRSTQNLQLSTSCRPITPSVGVREDIGRLVDYILFSGKRNFANQ
jgi:hypothetical protein